MPSALVVDDDPDLRGALAFKFERAGFAVRQAEDGAAGLAAASAEPPDVVLLDWMMPRLSGLEVCRALRADAALRGTSVVFLSARGLDADIESGLAAGADDFIAKPFSPGVVLDRVRALLAQSALTGPPGCSRDSAEELAPTPGARVSLILDGAARAGTLRSWAAPIEVELQTALPVPLPKRGLLHYMSPPGVLLQHGSLGAGGRSRRVAVSPLGAPRLLLARRRLCSDVRVPVTVRRPDGTSIDTMSAELSECGLRLDGTSLAPLGEPVELAIALDLFSAPLTAVAQLVRVDDRGGTTANFTSIGRESRERLTWRIFDHLLSVRATTLMQHSSGTAGDLNQG